LPCPDSRAKTKGSKALLELICETSSEKCPYVAEYYSLRENVIKE